MPMTPAAAAERGIELLNELLTLKSQQDGVPRSRIGVVGQPAGIDQFAQDVQEVAMLVLAMQHAFPLVERLSAAGRLLEQRGTLSLKYSDSYAAKAVDHLLDPVGNRPARLNHFNIIYPLCTAALTGHAKQAEHTVLRLIEQLKCDGDTEYVEMLERLIADYKTPAGPDDQFQMT